VTQADKSVEDVHSPWLLKVVDQVATAPQALALLNRSCAAAIVHHSARTLRYALAITKREDVAVDHAALVHACLLHDLGASVLATSAERFEVQGADLAVQFLEQHEGDGWSQSRREAVWAAIAVHTSPDIAERMSPLTRLVRLGVRADFGEDLVDPRRRAGPPARRRRAGAQRRGGRISPAGRAPSTDVQLAGGTASAVSQFWLAAWSATRPRCTLARMSSAFAVQTNGFGWSL